jgi:hypothetical protein
MTLRQSSRGHVLQNNGIILLLYKLLFNRFCLIFESDLELLSFESLNNIELKDGGIATK